MTQRAIPGASASHAFLTALSEQHRTRLTSGMKALCAAPGECLARAGEPADAFYLIQSGHVGIGTYLGKRGAVLIQTLGPGDVFGWSWLVPPYLWEFDARAEDAVQGSQFDAAWLRDQCEQDHELGYDLLKQLLAVVSGRLAACRIHHLDIYK